MKNNYPNTRSMLNKFSLSHDAKMGLLITFLVLLGVGVWVVIELANNPY